MTEEDITLEIPLWVYRQPRQRRILPLYIALIIVLLLQGAEQLTG